MLNITPDHLDRHGSMAAYTAAKFRIAAQQTQDDAFIYISDFEILQKHLETHPLESTLYPISLEQSVPQGAYGLDDTLTFTTHNSTFQMSIFDLALSGKHNAYNSMASGLAAKLLQIRKEVIRESLSNFQHVPHRLESVVSIRGVEYINDSKATNINSTWYALDSMTRPTVWIVGGVDKGNDYEQLKPLVADRVKAIVCLGLDNSKIIDAFHSDIEVIMETDSLATAVKVAYNLAGKGDAVLLSPACASFDLFENFEDRGNQFKHQVHQL
jgi:UDP-N-acetylmuramoylalanine--D-glutamate ligase